MFTGLAGALWVPLNGLTTPDILHWTFSGEIVFMTVLGGFRTFTGPIVGAIVFNYLKTYAVGYTVYWQMCSASSWWSWCCRCRRGSWARRPSVARGSEARRELLETRACKRSARPTRSTTWTSACRRARCWRYRLQRRRQDHPGEPDQRAPPADAGPIVFQGADITRLRPPADRGRHRAQLPARQPVRPAQALDNVALAIFSRQGKTRKLLTLAEPTRRCGEEAMEMLHQFGLRQSARDWPAGLSQGERKLLDVAVAYALRPKLLFLDEPTSGVSTREKAPIMDTIPRWSARRASRPPSSSTTWTWSSRTPTGSWPCTRARSSPTARRIRSAVNEQVLTTLIGTPEPPT